MQQRQSPSNIREVARRARVSIASVSRVMNDLPGVSPGVAKRIRKTAEELGYYPNTQARALVSGRSLIVGLIVSDITNPFFPEVIQSFGEMAAEEGYEVLLHSTSYDPSRMARAVRRMLERKVEGIAVMTSEFDEDLLQSVARRNVPMVFVDNAPAGERIATISVDYRTGIEQAVHHLLRLGHRRIAFVSGPLHLKSAFLRRKLFLEILAEKNIDVPPQFLVESDHQLEGGLHAVPKLLAHGNPPTAVMASNDLIAIGLLVGLDREGMRAPRDISVVGFDDIHAAQFSIPPLTTVRLSRGKLGKLALSALMQNIQDREHAVLNHSLGTQLIVRSSTGPAGSAAAAAKQTTTPKGRKRLHPRRKMSE